METEKESPDEKVKKLSTAELVKLAFPEEPGEAELPRERIREIKRMKRKLKDIPFEELNKMSPRERIWIAYFEQKRRERWMITLPVLMLLALWWLLVLADGRGWIDLPWVRQFVDPSEEVLRRRLPGG